MPNPPSANPLLHAAVAKVFLEVPRLEFGYERDGADLEIPCRSRWPGVTRCYSSQQSVIEKFRTESETCCRSATTPAEVRQSLARSLGLG